MKSKTVLQRIAILYQANLPPMKNGIQKPMKPGGYSDSGADIAVALTKKQIQVITPKPNPSIDSDFDWVFPDTPQGIQCALDNNANVLWLNTILYEGHPVEEFFGTGVEFVGQLPKDTDVYDDKWVTNDLLRGHALPIPEATLLKLPTFLMNDQDSKSLQHIGYPLVLKPLRGRGSQGVTVVERESELLTNLNELLSAGKYGDSVYAEKFLPGQEITVTVMPPGTYEINKEVKEMKNSWSLPAVKRFNHINGVAPYNGIVAIMDNSCVLDDKELEAEEIGTVYHECEKAADIISIKAPIRIDWRADSNGKYWMFDLNMKPNMTGASRSHRQNQDSLSALAARKIKWSYGDLLINMLAQRWRPSCQ